MLKFRVLLTSCAFTLMGLSSAFAVLPSAAYVDAASGSNSNAGAGCPVTAPCADLNTALSVITPGTFGNVIILKGAIFGPIVLTESIGITGNDQASHTVIAADPTAQVGCIGHLPAACGLTNNGVAVEIAAGVTHSIRLRSVSLSMNSGSGALKFTSGGQFQISHSVLRGGGSLPIVQLYANNPGTTQAQVYISHSDIGYNNASNPNAGAVEVKPVGLTSLKLHFNHVEVHNASYGIRTDASLLTNSTAVVATFVSESEFFSFPNAAVNAFSTAGTGTMNAVYNQVNILNAGAAIKANGPQSFVALTNSTIVGNGIGVQNLNGGVILSSVNNTIKGNGTDISGTLSTAPLQ